MAWLKRLNYLLEQTFWDVYCYCELDRKVDTTLISVCKRYTLQELLDTVCKRHCQQKWKPKPHSPCLVFCLTIVFWSCFHSIWSFLMALAPFYEVRNSPKKQNKRKIRVSADTTTHSWVIIERDCFCMNLQFKYKGAFRQWAVAIALMFCVLNQCTTPWHQLLIHLILVTTCTILYRLSPDCTVR